MADAAEKITLVRARLGDLRIAPRKVRLVTDSVKHLTLAQARWQLRSMAKKAARPVLKLIESAVANATNNFHLDAATLVIKNISVNQGIKMRRFKPRAQGRAFPIERYTSQVEVVLESIPAPVKKTDRKKSENKKSDVKEAVKTRNASAKSKKADEVKE